MRDILFVLAASGFALALAVAAGLLLAARFGGRSPIKQRTIAMGTVVLAAALAIAWILLAGKGVCC
ncbi:MAG TPA: hypothetical protein VEI05_03605 [Burkholderiaceae bacterium]|nr:hypothetical protein [Burkholderiaceae bacterium]